MRIVPVVILLVAVAGCQSDSGSAIDPTGAPTTGSLTGATTTAPDSTAITPATSASATSMPATIMPATSGPATTMLATTAVAGSAAPTTVVPMTVAPTAPETTALATIEVSVPIEVAPSIDELIEADQVLNIAHAGGDQDAPHSTMFALREAVAAGADMLELDVRLTGDGVLVVYHDADTTRTTNTTLTVSDTDLATLQTLDNAYWWSPQCWRCGDLDDSAYIYRGVRTGETEAPPGYTADDFRIMTLAEVATTFPTMPLDVEIKGGVEDAAALAVELTELGRVDSTIVVSFDSAVVEAFHSAAPDVATSPGTNEMAGWLFGGGELADYHDVIQIPPMHEDIEVLNAETLAIAEAADIEVWVWPNDADTQENEEFYRELITLGVDGIIAGRPAAATAAIAD